MTTKAFFLKNHVSSELHSAPLASLPTLSTRPQFATKDVYAKWCHEASTDHIFYTLAEPEFPGQRSSGKNPIKFLHGIVCDYDGAPEAINATLPTLKFGPSKAPAWVTTTFSGKARLIWVFERPVPTFSPDVFSRFLNILVKDFKLKHLLPGLDEGALITNPHTPYELGTEWRQPYGDARIPNSVVMLALHDASNKAKWKVTGPEIPMDAVAEEVARRWPGRWTGPFEDGARGVRFWDAKADNQTGATIRTLGVQAWTGEAKFMQWHELLGDAFVKQYRANRIGGAIDGTFFDGQSYYRRDAGGCWRDLNTEAAKRHLNVTHGLSAEAKKGQGSEVSQALTTIDNLQRVDGAFPCLFMKDDIVRDGSQKYLNIGRATPIPNSGAKREWGNGFPWLAQYLDGLFGDKQLNVFLSWLGHFYNCAHAGRPRKGQALFVAGPKSAGKTFLSQRVIGGLMGGFQEATNYVLGNTTFNEQLFHAPVWAVDDAVAAADPRRHSSYSQIVKKIVANPYQEYSAKFKKAVTFRWNGRLIITLNDDPTSIAMLPNIEGSILDKIVVLRAAPPGVSFAGADDKCAAELPYLADFLSNFRTPDWLSTRPDEVTRFGHDSWHHPELLQTAKESSDSNALHELLATWRTYHFRGCDKPFWTGSPTELYGELITMDMVKELVPATFRGVRALGRGLNQLIGQDVPWLASGIRSASGSRYVIKRPTDVELKDAA